MLKVFYSVKIYYRYLSADVCDAISIPLVDVDRQPVTEEKLALEILNRMKKDMPGASLELFKEVVPEAVC